MLFHIWIGFQRPSARENLQVLGLVYNREEGRRSFCDLSGIPCLSPLFHASTLHDL